MIVFASVLSALFGAVGNVYLKRLYSAGSIREIAPLNFLLNTVSLIPFAPFFYHFNFSLNALLWLILLFTFDVIANYFYYKAIETGEVTYASELMALSPVFTMLLSMFFISMVSFKVLLSVLGIIISVYILNLNRGSSFFAPFANLFRNKNYLGLLCAVFSGVSAIITKHVFNLNVINVPTLYLFRSAYIFLILYLIFKPSFKDYTFKVVFESWIRVLFIIGNMLLYLFAMDYGNAVVVVALANTVPAFVLVLSYFMFKEKITLPKAGAVMSIMFFIIMLNHSM